MCGTHVPEPALSATSHVVQVLAPVNAWKLVNKLHWKRPCFKAFYEFWVARSNNYISSWWCMPLNLNQYKSVMSLKFTPLPPGVRVEIGNTRGVCATL